jgi:hypothetical protein
LGENGRRISKVPSINPPCLATLKLRKTRGIDSSPKKEEKKNQKKKKKRRRRKKEIEGNLSS